jgi:protocatechuate 3,4-dioxygenase beta subunit
MERKKTKASMFLLVNFLVAMIVVYCFSTGCSTGAGGASSEVTNTNTTTPFPSTTPVTVKLIDENGEPMNNALIKAYSWNNFSNFDESQNYDQAITDENGTIILQMKNDGKSIIMAFHQDTKNNGQGIGGFVYTPDTNPYSTATVSPGPVVYGNVSDTYNQPAVNSRIRFMHTATPAILDADTNDYGVYCNPLGTGYYSYEVISPNGSTYSGNLTVDPTPNPQRRDIYSTPGPTVTITPGSVEGEVTNPESTPVHGAYVSLFDENNVSTHNTKTNESGRYNFSDVNPGNYNLSVLKDGYSRYFAPISVQNGQSTNANVQLQYYTPTPYPSVSPYPSPYPSPSPSPYGWVRETSNTSGGLWTVIRNPFQNRYFAYGNNGTVARREPYVGYTSAPWAMSTATPANTNWTSSTSAGSGHYVAGENNGQGIVSFTQDGTTYSPMPLPTSTPSPIGTPKRIESIATNSAGHPVAVGQCSNGYQVGYVYDGTSWNIIALSSYPGSFSTVYFNGLTQVIAGYAYSSGNYYPDIRYTNNGTTWNHSSICADGKINSINYSGTNWYAVGTGNNGYGFLYSTNNLANPWNQLSVATNPPGFNSVFFVSGQTGYIAANNGKIYQTTNGGSTWTVQNLSPSTTANINQVYFPDSSSGWAVGDNGTIYRNDNP